MYLVTFISRLSQDQEGYQDMAEAMVALAKEQPGFLRVGSWRDKDGLGCTLSWWDSLESIDAWRANLKHQAAQQAGRNRWYASYEVQVCEVLRHHSNEA